MTHATKIIKTEDNLEQELDYIYGEVSICGVTYKAGYALRKLDPISFRIFLSGEDLKWQCKYCMTKYDTENEANKCCSNKTDLT